MSKAERTPPFIMRVDGQRLVPGSAWDAERLASYRNGSTVNVIITQEKASWRQRKYWAILGAVVKAGAVRQTRAEDLHKAIRLKLGIVESFTTLGGATKVELRSTTAMDEQEFEGFYLEAMELLKDITGVDVETLGKEAADVGRDEQETARTPVPESAVDGASTDVGLDTDAPAAGADGTAMSPADPVGASISGDEPDQPAREAADQKGGASGNPDEIASPSKPITRADLQECIDKFLFVVTDPKVPDVRHRRGVLELTKDDWKRDLPERPDFIRACFETADRVLKGKVSTADAREYLEGLLP
jgi:hypothetical protein